MWRLVVLGLILGILQIRADCNICSSITNAACVSANQFQFCVNNIPSGTLNSCPSGNYCTGEAQICQTNASLLACTGCGQCNSENFFACLGVRTFALCLGTVTPSAITGSCAPDHVCNWDNPNICGTAAEGYQATCPLVDDEESTTTSTTAAPSGNVTPSVYCNQVREVGRFPYGTDQGTSCKKYISCNLSGGIWYGALYNCPGQTYFQPTTRNCNVTLPATCTASVRSLRLNNLLLL